MYCFIYYELNEEITKIDERINKIKDENNENKDIDEIINTINAHYKPYFNSHGKSSLNFASSFLYTGDIIINRVILIGGAGGSGKTSSLINGLYNKNLCYTTSCWNLIQGQKNKHPNIIGYSLPQLTGGSGMCKCEQIENPNIKYIIIDELTQIGRAHV